MVGCEMGHVITTPQQQPQQTGAAPVNTVVQQGASPRNHHQQQQNHTELNNHYVNHNNNQRPQHPQHKTDTNGLRQHNNHLEPQQGQYGPQRHYQQKLQHSQSVTSLRPTPKPRSSVPCRRTLSMHDPNSPKGQMALLEKVLQGEIEKLGTYRDERTSRTDVKESIARLVHILRQRMRILRRWRNGSVDYTDADLDEFFEFVTNTRIDVFAIEVQCIQDDLTRIDEYILILDDGSNDLRQNVDDDFQSVLNDIAKFQITADIGKSGKFADDIAARLSDVNDAVVFLRQKISEQTEPPARSPSVSSIYEDPLDRFETNPSRNRVLSTADRVRHMLKAFQEGDGHVDLGGLAKNEMCMENDSEVLRRQLRKIRRWQHNASRFDTEDVDDLQLIISAIERHLKPSYSIKTPSPRPATDGQFSPTMAHKRMSRSVSRSASSTDGRATLSTSVVSLSLESADLTTDSGVADTDPPSDDVFRDGASSTKDGFTDISELEEDEDFSERLI